MYLTLLRIFEKIEEVKMMTEIKFKIMIKLRIKENALKYLLNRRGSKGQGMKYSML